jgi:outer membrane protein assembly factor BamA
MLLGALLATAILRLRATLCVLIVLVASSPREARAQPAVKTEEATTFPVRIDEIRIHGLARTKESFIRREIGFREGDVVSKDDFDLAVARLWNTTIFAHVHGHVIREGDKTIVLFELEDRWTLNPLLSFGSGGGAFFFRIGATDANIAGRFLEAYGLYENFDGFHGGLLMLRDPRLFGRRLDLSVQGDRLIRPRSGFSDQRTSGAIEIAQLFDRDRMRLGLRTSVSVRAG